MQAQHIKGTVTGISNLTGIFYSFDWQDRLCLWYWIQSSWQGKSTTSRLGHDWRLSFQNSKLYYRKY